MPAIRWLFIVAVLLLGTARVEAGCTLSATPVSFGQYDVYSVTPVASTGSIVYQCGPNDRTLRIELDRGGASTFAGRRMVNGAETLHYNLYLNANATRIWGNGLEHTHRYTRGAPASNGLPVTVPLFGLVPAEQDVGPGRYTDSVTAIVNF